ncbi:MAG: EcsC family protein, partial [Flavisolibacter sp.]
MGFGTCLPAGRFGISKTLIHNSPSYFSISKLLMTYEQQAYKELTEWQRKMMSRPTIMNRLSKRLQVKMNSYIPEKVHKAITVAIKQMIRTVLFGAKHTTKLPAPKQSLEETETEVLRILKKYRRTASVEGGITGAGGILLGLADFPILLGIKLKML